MKPLSWRSLLLAAGFAFVLAGCESPTPRPMGSGASMDDTGDVIGNVPETTDSGGGIPEKDRLDLRGGVEYGAWRARRFGRCWGGRRWPTPSITPSPPSAWT